MSVGVRPVGRPKLENKTFKSLEILKHHNKTAHRNQENQQNSNTNKQEKSKVSVLFDKNFDSEGKVEEIGLSNITWRLGSEFPRKFCIVSFKFRN